MRLTKRDEKDEWETIGGKKKKVHNMKNPSTYW